MPITIITTQYTCICKYLNVSNTVPNIAYVISSNKTITTIKQKQAYTTYATQIALSSYYTRLH